jgi:hypothetical protein
MTATPSTPNRTSSSDALPALAADGQPAFTLSRRTVSGLDHDISSLVQELEELGVDLTSPKRKDRPQAR